MARSIEEQGVHGFYKLENGMLKVVGNCRMARLDPMPFSQAGYLPSLTSQIIDRMKDADILLLICKSWSWMYHRQDIRKRLRKKRGIVRYEQIVQHKSSMLASAFCSTHQSFRAFGMSPLANIDYSKALSKVKTSLAQNMMSDIMQELAEFPAYLQQQISLWLQPSSRWSPQSQLIAILLAGYPHCKRLCE